MKGKTLNDFIENLLTTGCEMEFVYHDTNYLIEIQNNSDKQKMELYVVLCNDDNTLIYNCFGETLLECVEQFEQAKIFENKTIYEVEQDIEVIFG